MPSASANISAKFMAQIEIGESLVSRNSEPAEASRPSIVSSSGSPAATSEPNASTRMPSVTGQENSSERIIAARLASLKSDHMPDAPVSATCTCSVPSAVTGPLRSSAARTIVFASALAPAMTIAVCPSREIVVPAWGRETEATRASVFNLAATRPIVCWNAGELVVWPELWTTTIRPVLFRPPNSRLTRSRTCTDSDPLACQPAPDSAVSTRGAKKPSATATTAQAMNTVRALVAA